MKSLKKSFGLTSASLHIIAMFLMLCDHACYTLLSDYEFLTCIGRLAFPIFAFMMVEGFYHTRDRKKYLKRLLIFGLVSEIPFNLMIVAQPFYPFHQNVMFTFALGLCMLHFLEKQKVNSSKHVIERIATSFVIVLIFSILAAVSMPDYNVSGILTIAVFYFCRKNTWWAKLLQLVFLYYINFELIGGLVYPITIGAFSFELPRQGLAILSLPFIWAYNGEKGYDAKWFKYFCYAFYPAHSLILFIIAYVLYF